jgi:hypothetical protein
MRFLDYKLLPCHFHLNVHVGFFEPDLTRRNLHSGAHGDAEFVFALQNPCSLVYFVLSKQVLI